MSISSLDPCPLCGQVYKHLPLCPRHELERCDGCPHSVLVRDEADVWLSCKYGDKKPCIEGWYDGIGSNSGKRIYLSNALSYALDQCGIKLTEKYDKEDRKSFVDSFVEWFYSGNWVLVRAFK